MDPEFERKHPRNPEDGRFRDKAGAPDWARKALDQLGVTESDVGVSKPAPDKPNDPQRFQNLMAMGYLSPEQWNQLGPETRMQFLSMAEGVLDDDRSTEGERFVAENVLRGLHGAQRLRGDAWKPN